MSEKQQPPLPSPEVVRDLVKVGVEQIKVRQKELDLQEKESQRQYDFAKQALVVQAEDRRDARQYRRKRTNDRYLFVGALFLVVVGLVLALSYMNKDDLAKEVAKAVGYFSAGGLSGYGVSKARSHREIDTDEDEEPAPSL